MGSKAPAIALYTLVILCTYLHVTSSQQPSFFDGIFGNPRVRNTFRRETTTQSANSFRPFRSFFGFTPAPAPSFDEQFRNRPSPRAVQGGNQFLNNPVTTRRPRRRDRANRRRNRVPGQRRRPTPQFLALPRASSTVRPPKFRSPFDTSTRSPFDTSIQPPNIQSPFNNPNRPSTIRSPSQPRSSLIPSAEQIVEIRRRANAFISQDDEWLPNLLQLVFHTCVGGCDGCLNLEERENRGLAETYAAIRAFWNATQRNALSLADFIVLMATEAAEIGMFKAEGDLTVTPSIEFRPGRLTCRDPDNYRLRHRFPKGDAIDGVQFLVDEFGYADRKLAIALLGAHSLGACRQENLGFAGRWDNTPLILDNHYYRSMTETPVWNVVPISGTFQWNSSEPNGPMMLHADMALVHSFQLDANNRPSCSRSIDCGRSPDSIRVSVYASSIAAWIRDFTEAFLQMCDKRPAPQ